MIDGNDNQKKKEEVEFPGIIEKHAPGTFSFYPCPHCKEGKADFASYEARERHLKDYHRLPQGLGAGDAPPGSNRYDIPGVNDE